MVSSSIRAIGFLTLLVFSRAVSAQEFSVAAFLPRGYVKDGSVSYQAEIQKAIDAALPGSTVVFPPMKYKVDESGWKIHSHLILAMHGAIIQVDEGCKNDGQVFFGKDIENLQVLGGRIMGRNEVWADGVNIRGFYLTGACKEIRFQDIAMFNLSSNGIGIFASAEQSARDVWVTDVILENCCNKYGDYSSTRPGPEKGSKREDQGAVAFYYVNDFVVRGCRFEKSRSDGTHFYKCKQGQFVHNKVYSAQMGGYFLESCEDVLASDNLIRDNGSRGVTIERGSKRCTLKGNIVANSGREGLWAPDCSTLIVIGNVFDKNGRKPNGKKVNHVWNANITINEDPTDPTKSPTEEYIVADNIIYTTEEQVAAIRVDADKSTGIIVRNNILRGPNRKILIEGDAKGKVVEQGNEKE